MLPIGLSYLEHKEKERSNRANEAIKDREIDTKVDIADKDRASREEVASLDRISKEGIATADRLSREGIADKDRLSKEGIAEADRRSKEGIAEADRIAKISIADADRLSKEGIATADREQKDKLSRDLASSDIFKDAYQYQDALRWLNPDKEHKSTVLQDQTFTEMSNPFHDLGVHGDQDRRRAGIDTWSGIISKLGSGLISSFAGK